jgi:hypothetical protein
LTAPVSDELALLPKVDKSLSKQSPKYENRKELGQSVKQTFLSPEVRECQGNKHELHHFPKVKITHQAQPLPLILQ